MLLHGAFSGASAWTGEVPGLTAAGYRVHLPERRGHVRTPDVDGPLTYAAMADDTAAYLDATLSEPADLVGWSDGAVVAVLVAPGRPELVKRLVLIGQYFNSAGKAVVDALPGGRLAVLPGSHSLPVESPEIVTAVLLQPLRGGPPEPSW